MKVDMHSQKYASEISCTSDSFALRTEFLGLLCVCVCVCVCVRACVCVCVRMCSYSPVLAANTSHSRHASRAQTPVAQRMDSAEREVKGHD